ncbi:hypothetical protein GT037_003055 [Alternaria burnsii]|uniref:Uncharacterized protein n=1 Tax=Alternaria burnsii TaxID=1187904 RepID=A0A8H7BC59_9PLEO|nr:uncharacterized protein GT037_003055 [Alternaria burnsii]KAF7679307.1 hypothetical protein GT037_003055 [Alternaria burnsii]
MIGRSVDSAIPTILFFCEGKEPRKKAKKTIDEGGLLGKLAGFRTGHLAKLPGIGRLIQPAAGNEDIRQSTGSGMISDVYFDPSAPIKAIAMPIFIKQVGNILRKATANAVFEGEKCVYLSVSHVFFGDVSSPPAVSTTSDSEFDYGSGTEDEDDDRCMDATSRASVSSLEEGSDDQSESPTCKSTSTTSPVPSVQSDQEFPDVADLVLLGHLTTYSVDLDWAVIDVCHIGVYSAISQLKTDVQSGSIQGKLISSTENMEIVAHTSRGLVHGQLSHTATYMRLPNNNIASADSVQDERSTLERQAVTRSPSGFERPLGHSRDQSDIEFVQPESDCSFSSTKKFPTPILHSPNSTTSLYSTPPTTEYAESSRASTPARTEWQDLQPPSPSKPPVYDDMGKLRWIIGNKLEDFKTTSKMVTVRQAAMGSYLEKVHQMTMSDDQGATRARSIEIPKSKRKNDSKKKDLESNNRLQPDSNVPGSQVAHQSTLSRRPIVVPIIEEMRGFYPFDLYPVPELFSLGRLDPFGVMFPSQSQRISLERLKLHFHQCFATERMMDIWMSACLHYPHTFLGTLYIASSHYDALRQCKAESLETAGLRQEVIHFVSEHLTNRENGVADHNIVAVLQLITGNVIGGVDAGLKLHQDGLQTMIRQRGGLQKLDSILASMVSWLSLETAVLHEKQPVTEYSEYCMSHSSKTYASTLAIPESPVWCPHEDYITLQRSDGCNEQTLQLVVDMRRMIDGLMNEKESTARASESLDLLHEKLTMYTPVSQRQLSEDMKCEDWRYEAVHLVSTIQAISLARRIPLSEALAQVCVADVYSIPQLPSEPFLPHDKMTTADEDLFASSVSPSAVSVVSSRCTPMTIDTRDSVLSSLPSISASKSYSSALPSSNTMEEPTSQSKFLQELVDALEKSDMSNCWDYMAGVLLWIALTAGAASSKSDHKVLRRYFSALAIRVSMFLCFEHPEALHATLLRMANILKALHQPEENQRLKRRKV